MAVSKTTMTPNLIVKLGSLFALYLSVKCENDARCDESFTGDHGGIKLNLRSLPQNINGAAKDDLLRYNHTWCITPSSGKQDMLLVLKFINIKYLTGGDQIIMPDETFLDVWYAYVNLPTYQTYALLRHKPPPSSEVIKILKNQLPYTNIIRADEPVRVGVSIQPKLINNTTEYYFLLDFSCEYWFIPVEGNFTNNISLSLYLNEFIASSNNQKCDTTHYTVFIIAPVILLLIISGGINGWFVIRVRRMKEQKQSTNSQPVSNKDARNARGDVNKHGSNKKSDKNFGFIEGNRSENDYETIEITDDDYVTMT